MTTAGYPYPFRCPCRALPQGRLRRGCRSPEVRQHHPHHRAHRPRLSRSPLGQRDRRRHQTPRHSALAEVAARRLRTRLDDDLQDAGHHEPHLQSRNAARESHQEPRAACRDTLQNRLQGHCPDALLRRSPFSNPDQHPSFHACAHLRGNGTPGIGDSGAALGRHTVG